MDLLKTALEVIDIEIDGLKQLKLNLGNEINLVVEAILSTKGRVIICGMGKSGIIGKKITASLASTGTPSFFMHPGEAFHGDLGMVKSEDVFIAISNSGETDEVLKLLPFLKDNKNVLIAITGNKHSTLATQCHYHLDVSVPAEACPLQLAPTASTTAALVIGDVLTVILMEARNFKPENFARFHPGGSLGRRLLSKVKDEMVADNLPFIAINSSIIDLISVMTNGKQGMAIVIHGEKFVGVVTDGDLRRAIEKFKSDVIDKSITELCSYSPKTVSSNASMQTAIYYMTEHEITSLIVKDSEQVVGILKK